MVGSPDLSDYKGTQGVTDDVVEGGSSADGFAEKLRTNGPPTCVDGRMPEPGSSPEAGYQMLGGSLGPLVLAAVATGQSLNEEYIKKGFELLKKKGYSLGVHTSDNPKDGDSGCGFADNLRAIVQTASKEEESIASRLLAWHAALSEEVSNFNFSLYSAFEMLRKYSSDGNIAGAGLQLIGWCQNNGAHSEVLTGEHKEEAAFINSKPDVTFDKKKAAPAFSLDLDAAAAQAGEILQDQGFSVNQSDLVALSLILYEATLKVLVEAGGKPIPPLVDHH